MENKNVDFLCERRLKELNPDLHQIYAGSIFAMDRLLANYKTVFPYFTNHTFEHSEQVINYCNIIAGYDNIMKLNADELYCLLMGASLHDVGMGISMHDFEDMKYRVPGFKKYEQDHLVVTVKAACREFHQELSAEFIKKYRNLFEIPSDQHLYCICQIARGHRRMDFLDKTEFNPEYKIGENVIRLPYIAALVKLADELDVTAERNLFFDYSRVDTDNSKQQILCYKCHQAIKNLEVDGDTLILNYSTDEKDVQKEIDNMVLKVEKTYSEYIGAVSTQNDFEPNINKIVFSNI